MQEIAPPPGLEWMKASFDAEYQRRIALEQELMNRTVIKAQELREVLLSLDWIRKDDVVEGHWENVYDQGTERIEYVWYRGPIRVTLILGYNNTHYGPDTCVIWVTIMSGAQKVSNQFRVHRGPLVNKASNETHSEIARFVLRAFEELKYSIKREEDDEVQKSTD